MGLVDTLLRRSTAYRLRRDYDRIRERTDKVKSIDDRMEILRLLDQLEPSVISIEEHHMSRYDKKRIGSYVKSNLRKIKLMLDESKIREKRRKTGQEEKTDSYLKDSRQIHSK